MVKSIVWVIYFLLLRLVITDLTISWLGTGIGTTASCIKTVIRRGGKRNLCASHHTLEPTSVGEDVSSASLLCGPDVPRGDKGQAPVLNYLNNGHSMYVECIIYVKWLLNISQQIYIWRKFEFHFRLFIFIGNLLTNYRIKSESKIKLIIHLKYNRMLVRSWLIYKCTS